MHTKKWQGVLKKPCTFTFFVLITGRLTKKETDFEQEKMATVAEDSVIKVAALSGSLRKASYNEGAPHHSSWYVFLLYTCAVGLSFGVVEAMHLYFLLSCMIAFHTVSSHAALELRLGIFLNVIVTINGSNIRNSGLKNVGNLSGIVQEHYKNHF